MPSIDDATRPRAAGSVQPTPRQRAAGDHPRVAHEHVRHPPETLTRAAEALHDRAGDVADLRAAVQGLAPSLTAQQVAGPLGLLGMGV